MSRRSLLLFAATSVIWASSFLFIRVAVEHMPPAAVVFGRTLLGAAFLVPLAAWRHAFRGLRPVIVPVIVVTLLDMAGPTFLTAWGEQHVTSSMAEILTATDPLFTALWYWRSPAAALLEQAKEHGLVDSPVRGGLMVGPWLHGCPSAASPG